MKIIFLVVAAMACVIPVHAVKEREQLQKIQEFYNSKKEALRKLSDPSVSNKDKGNEVFDLFFETHKAVSRICDNSCNRELTLEERNKAKEHLHFFEDMLKSNIQCIEEKSWKEIFCSFDDFYHSKNFDFYEQHYFNMVNLVFKKNNKFASDTCAKGILKISCCTGNFKVAEIMYDYNENLVNDVDLDYLIKCAVYKGPNGLIDRVNDHSDFLEFLFKKEGHRINKDRVLRTFEKAVCTQNIGAAKSLMRLRSQDISPEYIDNFTKNNDIRSPISLNYLLSMADPNKHDFIINSENNIIWDIYSKNLILAGDTVVNICKKIATRDDQENEMGWKMKLKLLIFLRKNI